MFVSPHAHPESSLTGSTVANMVGKAKELGRKYFAYTDNGHLSACLKAYNLCKPDKKSKSEHLKKELKFIPGLEFYFKDSECPIISGTQVDRCKYFTATVYCENQDAYQALCRMVSQNNFATIPLYEEQQQLWTWKHLQEISKFDVTLVLGGVHCMVGKTMLAGKADLGEKILVKLRELFNDRLYFSYICEPWNKKWNSVVEIKYANGTKSTCLTSDFVSTDKARRIKAIDLVERLGHSIVKSIVANNTYQEINLVMDHAVLHKGFLPLPGGDVTLKLNRFYKALSKKHNIPVLASDYAYYANKEDKIVQTMKLEGNNKFQPNLHMKTDQEIYDYLLNILKLSKEEADETIKNNGTWASRFDNFNLKYEWRLADPGEDSLKKIMEIIKKNGRMKWNDPKYVDRLKEELNVIAKNGKMDLSSYFLPIYDVIAFYKSNGRLVGPGRGSAAGSLLSFLLGITEIDPFLYDLSFSRFYSLDRIFANKVADIDSDFEDRELLVGKDGKSGYLYGRWGNQVAQISTRQNLRLKSAIKDVNRFMNGKVEEYIENFTKGLPASPQGVNDSDFVFGYENEDNEHTKGLFETSESLREYASKKPNEWEIVKKSLGIVRSSGTHACAFVIANCPISDVVPLRDGHITQVEAKEAEFAGLVKMDFLVISQLKDIRICMDLINQKNNVKLDVGSFIHNNEKTFIWSLPEDQNVYKSIWNGDTETCFQINTKSMIPYVMDILPKNIEDLSLILSLVRPGPLDFINPNTGRNMAEEYVYRRKGNSYEDIKILNELIPETMSTLVYQEQITKIAKGLAGFNGLEAENLREAIGKKKQADLTKMKPKFIEGVISSGKTTQQEAEELWERIETFGRYAFNKSHGISYSHITYACMFLRHYYPLEWWSSVLTNATEQEITGKFWPYVKDIISSPDINLSGESMVVDYKNEKIRAKLGIIRGLGDATIEPIVNNRPYKDIQDFIDKEVAGNSLSHKLILVGVLDSLFPPKLSLHDKLKMYEDAVEKKKYLDKIKEAELSGKKIRATQPKEGKVPEGYLNLHPLDDAALKKSILPSMLIDLHDLGKKYSKVLAPFELIPHVTNARGYKTQLIDGEKLRRLDEIEGDSIMEDIYVATTCYVIKAEEFSYAKGSKRALKLTLDAGNGYVSEKVLWPDYNTGQLLYSPELAKGAIATVFLRKKVGKKDMSIQSITVETAGK